MLPQSQEAPVKSCLTISENTGHAGAAWDPGSSGGRSLRPARDAGPLPTVAGVAGDGWDVRSRRAHAFTPVRAACLWEYKNTSERYDNNNSDLRM